MSLCFRPDTTENYAIRLLNHPPVLPAAKRGPRPRRKSYGPATRKALEALWRIANCICAKAETAAVKPNSRVAFRLLPCLVHADGFYEWQKLFGGVKQARFITTSYEEPFAFAGLWEWWQPKDAAPDTPGLETFTILITEPNSLRAPLHNRMPVMLAQDGRRSLLATPDDCQTLLRRFPTERMECWPVRKAVGSVRTQWPELVGKVSLGDG